MGDSDGASALEQFLLLSKGAKGRACAALIEKAVNSPSIFVFGELLDMPNVQAVRERACALRRPSLRPAEMTSCR